jgi:hypothetical protein
MWGVLFLAIVESAQPVAAGDGATKSRLEVIALAREATLHYCGDHEPVIGGYYRARCSFLAERTSEGWLVSGHPLYENSRGEQAIVEGGDVVLYYSPTGQLLRHEGAAF